MQHCRKPSDKATSAFHEVVKSQRFKTPQVSVVCPSKQMESLFIKCCIRQYLLVNVAKSDVILKITSEKLVSGSGVSYAVVQYLKLSENMNNQHQLVLFLEDMHCTNAKSMGKLWLIRTSLITAVLNWVAKDSKHINSLQSCSTMHVLFTGPSKALVPKMCKPTYFPHLNTLPPKSSVSASLKCMATHTVVPCVCTN